MTAQRSLSPRHRVRNNVVILFHRLGLPFGPLYLLTVPGRRSGLPRTTPVAPVVVDGTRYLLQAYPGSDWVKNARAAGYGVLTRGRRKQRVELVELPEEERGRILREFPGHNPRGVGAFVRNGLVDSGSPEHFEEAAARCPVFRVAPRAD
ncbi:nitroreductase family deazaflavin-dependent oxidoreductase [Streptomyces sp. SID13666]|uniref:nitroreductase family deazaflavin-dependent oxidoreductase n=1 Tax=unclassified Streptomyces TaxID=2593676 RepID=UPI0013C2005D|nr:MULTISPECIES: nitroreductase family deazaflavin-dependent oxidoreductase [unclassified Streptomyces]NEA55107.1 nitroreductase family deazaflavin-dependent oxidoreductase [Streptomyces sp. SID13666]NEA71114.1 nitroreductase family deazaflavin-dependent oxidoreductase [Streptomyces sp. SID13588]